MPFRKYRDLGSLNSARIEVIMNVPSHPNSLIEVHKDVAARNTSRRTHAQDVHNPRTNVMPLTINKKTMWWYARTPKMITNSNPYDAVQRSPMCVIETKSDLVFIVDDLTNRKRNTMDAQRVVTYSVTKNKTRVSDEFVEQVTHFDKKYQLVEEVTGVRNPKERMKWTLDGLDMNKRMEIHGNQYLKSKRICQVFWKILYIPPAYKIQKGKWSTSISKLNITYSWTLKHVNSNSSCTNRNCGDENRHTCEVQFDMH